ncbi:hypothetical protein BKA56DRAFT_620518 [Ilyonectria sp. MPI-CAGE-AT-0026]|nr:hypothetical protein BKA56DRAFT_620518 [Ilyonectria sp. MPI-CAGE-AT-0026]
MAWPSPVSPFGWRIALLPLALALFSNPQWLQCRQQGCRDLECPYGPGWEPDELVVTSTLGRLHGWEHQAGQMPGAPSYQVDPDLPTTISSKDKVRDKKRGEGGFDGSET